MYHLPVHNINTLHL